MDYLGLLEHSFTRQKEDEDSTADSRLEYLSNHIFNFTTYDAKMDALFATKAIQVCEAINNRTTLEFIKDKDNYTWFLAMINMPFFLNKISWGTSVRGAFWQAPLSKLPGGNRYSIECDGIWLGDDQQMEFKVDRDDWQNFVEAMVLFAKPEMHPEPPPTLKP